jgi:hypothetical protein
MAPANHLLSNGQGYCFAKENEVYVVFLPMEEKTTSIDLGTSGKEFSIQWYDPRNGGALQEGSTKSLSATGTVSLGFPSKDRDKDWVALLQLKK